MFTFCAKKTKKTEQCTITYCDVCIRVYHPSQNYFRFFFLSQNFVFNRFMDMNGDIAIWWALTINDQWKGYLIKQNILNKFNSTSTK